MSTVIILGRTEPWFLLILPPLIIIFIFVERFYIAANRQLKVIFLIFWKILTRSIIWTCYEFYFQRMESTTRSPIYSNFGETIAGSSIIRAYGEEKRFINENVEKIDYNLKFQYANLMCNRWLGLRLEVFANLIVFAVAFYGKLIIYLQ